VKGRPRVPDVEDPELGDAAGVLVPAAVAVDVWDAVTVFVVTVADAELDDVNVIGTTTRCRTPAPHTISR
jgi:hypothetical protein